MSLLCLKAPIQLLAGALRALSVSQIFSNFQYRSYNVIFKNKTRSYDQRESLFSFTLIVMHVHVHTNLNETKTDTVRRGVQLSVASVLYMYRGFEQSVDNTIVMAAVCVIDDGGEALHD